MHNQCLFSVYYKIDFPTLGWFSTHLIQKKERTSDSMEANACERDQNQ